MERFNDASSPWSCRAGLALIVISSLASGLFGQAPGCMPSVAKHADLAPHLLYTDILSGPTTGGENNQGVYLSIFGTNLRSPATKGLQDQVLIGGHSVARVLYQGPSRGRPDIEQLTVQVGSLEGAKQGISLPIVVETEGRRSNSDLTFTPNPGVIYFADNVHGNDSTARPGDIHRPYRHIQNRSGSRVEIWPHLEPGDFVVLRGTGKPWQDVGADGYFVRFLKSGTAPRGIKGSGPITVMGYPGEDVFVDETYAVSPAGAFAGSNGPHGRTAANHLPAGDPSVCEQNSALLCSQWITIADLRIEGGGHDGAVDLEIGGNHWRVINNNLTAATAAPSARSGGIAGDGLDAALLGNMIHAIDSPDPGLENHGIYIDGPGSYEIAYNYLFDVPGGSGFQIYGDETATGSFITDHVSFHHNWIDHVAKYCINLADNSGSDLQVYDNVASNCGLAGLRLNSNVLSKTKIWHNTFAITNTRNHPHYGAVVIDMNPGDGAVEIRDNIFAPMNGTNYTGGDAPASAFFSPGRFLHNLYFGGTSAAAFDPHAVTADSMFVDAKACDFHLQQTGFVADGWANDVDADFDLATCPDGLALQIGAYARCTPTNLPIIYSFSPRVHCSNTFRCPSK